MKRPFEFALCVVCVLWSAVAQGAVIYTDSFESPDVSGPGFAFGAPAGWVTGGTQPGTIGLAERATNPGFPLVSGLTQYVFMATSDGLIGTLTSNSIGLSAAGSTYDLSVVVGNRSASFASAEGGEYRIALLEDGVEQVSTSLAGILVPSGGSATLSTSYLSATNGAALTIELRWTNTNSLITGQGVFDDLTVTQIVPEPASMLLLGMGGVALASRRRRGSPA